MTDNPSKERTIIVMGPTGVGKTTFINCLAGRDGPGVGHGIESCTAKVELIRVEQAIHGRNITFVDTPGLDDTYKADIEILADIAAFLVKVYKKNVKIDTILYLHRISDIRMSGSLLKNLKIFVSLCGIQSMPNVTIVTTMWHRVDKGEGEIREEELKRKMWFDMIEKGCQVKRFDGTYKSALCIIEPGQPETRTSGPSTSTDPSAIQPTRGPLLSSEMVDKRKKLKATAAGNELNKEIKNLIKKQRAASRKLRELSKQSADDTEKRILEQELQETDQKIKKASEQHAVLKRNVLDWLFGPKPETSEVPRVGQT
ncbi:hypothetical protein FRC14_002835 [Serendipita sp. 396]|nr:hypothetical protein FRC14_002835 [Serendipita sp. 396]